MTSSTGNSDKGTDFETVPADEIGEIDETAALTVTLQDVRASTEKGQEGKVLRGVHPKSHGCVKAEFTINEDIENEYRIGLFAHPGRTYEAWIRFSNASVLREHDLKEGKNGSRGMAIKVLGVDGKMLDQDNGQSNQDFLMINTPEFVFANVRDYLRLDRILARDPLGADPNPYFAPGKLRLLQLTGGEENAQTALQAFIDSDPLLNNLSDADKDGTFSSLKIAGKIESAPHTVRNPLQVQYFGAAPFLFGADKVMRFSAIPSVANVQNPFTEATTDDPSGDYLREALSETMNGEKDVTFDFGIVVRRHSQENSNIEDATTSWEEEASGYNKVARITIRVPQSPSDQCAVDHCEQLAFSPWHSLADHQPLGGINRLRRKVYADSAEHRSAGDD